MSTTCEDGMKRATEHEGVATPPLLKSSFDARRKRKPRRKTQNEADTTTSLAVLLSSAPPEVSENVVQDMSVFGSYMKREELFEEREARGEMHFVYLCNDNTLPTLKLLTDVKNVYSRQLPNMPKEYICKLVFNKSHRSMAVLKEGKQVIGGITYKTFTDQTFAEIAFCAVEGLEQVQGIGTRMMNYCKTYARQLDHIQSFLTYADNNAIGYFAKQGFVKRELPQKKRHEVRKVSQSKKKAPPAENGTLATDTSLNHYEWAGYIKDYDGGTLMECQILPQVPYTSSLRVTQKHRASLTQKMQQNSRSHVILPGMSFPKQRKRRRLNPADIPGLKEAGWTPDQLITNLHFRIDGVWEESDPESLQQFLHTVLDYIKKLPEAEPFLKPVTVEDAIDYFDIVTDPMDLSLIERRLVLEGYYSSLEIFKADLNLMISNCRLYNRVDTFYYKFANRLEQAFQRYLNENMKEF